MECMAYGMYVVFRRSKVERSKVENLDILYFQFYCAPGASYCTLLVAIKSSKRNLCALM